MSFDDSEKPKRTWKEIDRNRDLKLGRPAPVASGQGGLKGQAAKRYRSQLDRLFSGGELPPEIRAQVPAIKTVEKIPRSNHRDAVLKAISPSDIAESVDRYLSESEMPREPDLLAKILAHPKGSHRLEALTALVEVLALGRPVNANLLKSRIHSIRLTCDDDDVQELVGKALVLLD